MQKVPINPYGMHVANTMAPVMMVPSTAPSMYGMRSYAPVQVYTQTPVPIAPPQLNEADLKQVLSHHIFNVI